MKLIVVVSMAAAAGGCGVSPADPPPEPIAVPFAVSDYYSPAGFFGDGALPGALKLDRFCPERVIETQGDCYTLTYKPGVKRFAGLFWQHPSNNWGFWRGHKLAPGAKRISFRVRGGAGSAGRGVSAGAGQKDTPNPHNDSFKLEEVTVPLTNAWVAHEVPFRDAPYEGPSGVIGAFALSFTAGDADDPIVFYLDDVRWQR